MMLTGQFVSSVLVLPVVIASWSVGIYGAVLTIAVQTLVTLLMVPPTFSLQIASGPDAVRFAITIAVSVLAAGIVAHLRTIERRYRKIVELASEGIWSIDAAGRTTFVNDRMAELLGYPPHEMLGRRFSEFVRVEDVPAAEQRFENRKRGASEWDEIELMRKDGSSIWAGYAGTPMFESGVFAGALAVVSDRSERKRDETTIRRQAEALQRADRQKDQFLAMLAHELRNPLAPIVTALQLMERRDSEAFRRERTVIARQIDQITRLVDDLLDVSRFMRGTVDIHREAVNMAEAVAEGSEAVASLVSRKEQTLEVDAPADITIEGDKARINQVIVNLLTNAAKYTPSGGRIVVTVALEGEWVALRVRDNGAGIPRHFLPSLFKPFTQTPQAQAQSEGGLGLGLAIVRSIVVAHGGSVDARSEGEGRGSEFIVRLPVSAPAARSTRDAGHTTGAPDRA